MSEGFESKIRFLLPSAINCWFHVYEEPTRGFGVQRHILSERTKTACARLLTHDDTVLVGIPIVLDRTWCRTCAVAVVHDAPNRGGQVSDLDGVSLPRNRPLVDHLTLEELMVEYAWCDEMAKAPLDDVDIWALKGRRKAIEKRMAMLEMGA